MLIRKVRALINLLHDIRSRLEFVQIALGRVEERQVRATSARIFHESEYKVFSQWGEDGLIQRLIQEIPGKLHMNPTNRYQLGLLLALLFGCRYHSGYD